LQSANRAFYEAFAVVEDDVVGRPLLAFGVWRAPTLRALLEEVAATGTGFQDIEVEHTAGASDRILRLVASAIPLTDRHRSILVGIADVTERRRLEHAREVAKREQDAFLDAVSHELRTPLSAILLWGQALQHLDPGDPRSTQAIETIVQSARFEAELVDDLLELAMSRSASSPVGLEVIDPSAIVRETIDEARQAAGDKHIALEVSLAPGVRIAADPRRIRQITLKLVSNAIKFTPSGGTVWVTLAPSDGMMELSIRDTGPGMSSEFLARAFEPFLQADGSSTRAHRGLGIGLALVRHYVERQGGTIDVVSPNGQGTTFTVRIPTGARG